VALGPVFTGRNWAAGRGSRRGQSVERGVGGWLATVAQAQRCDARTARTAEERRERGDRWDPVVVGAVGSGRGRNGC
jgi:hypothetical protein